jgi:hypothetical protein
MDAGLGGREGRGWFYEVDRGRLVDGGVGRRDYPVAGGESEPSVGDRIGAGLQVARGFALIAMLLAKCAFMLLVLYLLGAVIWGLVAHADSPTEYLNRVQVALPTIYDRYGGSKLLNEGNRICSMEASHWSYSGEIKMVQNDLPMSEGSAMHLIAIVDAWLGC